MAHCWQQNFPKVFLGGVRNSIRVYTSRPGEWDNHIRVENINGELLYISEKIDVCSANLDEVLREVKLVFVTVPAFLFRSIASKIAPYIRPGVEVCIVPGNGGAEFYFQDICSAGGVLGAFERVHVTAKLREYGKTVCQLSRKKIIRIALMPNSYLGAGEFSQQMETLFSIRCESLPNMLCASLAPSNPILHTPRLYRLFMNYDGSGYVSEKYMYDTWDDETSRLLFACDSELQDICRSLDRLDLSSVPSLRDYYESPDLRSFTEKMKSIPAFRGAKAPMIQRGDGWHPDFNSRLFRADIECSLWFMKEVAVCCKVRTETMDEILGWYKCVTGNEMESRLTGYSAESLYEFYMQG